jgi:hypothetical protein
LAVGMLLAGEGITRDAYVQITEKMFGNYPMRPEQSPEGLIVHTAGQTPDGWYIYDLWESREQFQRFLDQNVAPAMQELGVGGDGGPEPQFFDIETLVKGASL